MRNPLPKKFLYTAYRFSAIHLGPGGHSKRIDGTCFYLRAGAEIFVVTNKHNWNLSHSQKKYVGYRIDSLLISGYFGFDQYAECDFVQSTVTFGTPNNHAEDVVVIDVTGIPFRFRRKRQIGEDRSTTTTSLSPFAIDVGMLATDADLKSICPGDTVLFPSYPALYDLNGTRPIMRSGTIASDPESDYQADRQDEARRIACEAYSTEGSSGSPVFCPLQNSDVVVVGINSGHLTGEEPRIGTIHAGLSYCFKPACILEAIEKLRANHAA